MSRKVTVKMRKASDILGTEMLADDYDFVLNLYKRGKVSREQVYSAMEHFGYRWKNGRWVLVLPRWFENALKRRRATTAPWFLTGGG